MRFKSEQTTELPLSESQCHRSIFARWRGQRPVLSIGLVSLLAVIINCYPILFCGKSFVSPACVPVVIYDWWPPMPGMTNTPPINAHGSDTAAMLIWAVPMGFVESRSFWQYGTLPLWNRCGHAGEPLIGQAVSMLGDPLQMIVILGHGSAVAWDIKFLLAKFLFCFGFGLLIFRLLGSHSLSLVYAMLAAYCGAFFYINNHPALFVFCYSPWILLSAIAMLDLQSSRFFRWGLVWLLANFSCFNGGHVEVAVVLIGGLNLAAVVFAWTKCHNATEAGKIFARMTIGALLFFGLTAPVWMSFLAALENSYSVHSQIQVIQLPFVSLLGIFDDVFFRLPLPDDTFSAPAPGSSFLIMAGCILSILKWRLLKRETFFWINGCAILLTGGCIFGWIPRMALAAIPLLNRVGHVYTDFSYLLVIQLTIQSAYGFKCLAQEENFWRTVTDVFWMGLILAGMTLLFYFGITHRAFPWNYFWLTTGGTAGTLLLFSFLKSRRQLPSAAGWGCIILLAFIPNFRFGLYTFGSGNWLMLPGPRTVLNASSPSIDWIKRDQSKPFRVVGLGWNLSGNYSTVYGIESISSCAPLSSGDFIDLVKKFPGVKFMDDWIIEIEQPAHAHALLNLLNVKYLLARPPVAVPTGIDFNLITNSDFALVKNPDAWPRAFFSDKIISLASNEDFIAYLDGHGNKPFIALTPDEIEKQPVLQPLENTNAAAISPAKNYQLLPNSTAFDIHAPSAGMVCLTEEQAKDFNATANGKPEKILTVNRAFKGIYLDKPGDYHVQFVYRPRHWRLACALFLAAIAGIIVIAVRRLCSIRRAQDGS